MKKTENGYFLAGDFAKICNISKQTLLYYDQMGVFKPTYRDENGYRYYSLQQFDILATILTLREILSLSDIKEYTTKRNTKYFIDLFENHISDLENEIKKKTTIKNMMIQKVERVNKAHKIAENNGIGLIYLKYCDKEYFKTSKMIQNFSDKRKQLEALSYIMHYRMNSQTAFNRAIGGIVSKECFLDHNRNEYIQYFAEVTPEEIAGDIYIKPEGNYLIYYHKGHYDTAYTAYSKITEYADKCGYKIGEHIYEESIVDEAVEINSENYIVKISVYITSA